MLGIHRRHTRNQILKYRTQREDHVLLVRIGLKEKLNKSARKPLWRGKGTGEGSVKLKKRKAGFMEGDLFFLYEQRDGDT